jgi:hypothetical protein
MQRKELNHVERQGPVRRLRPERGAARHLVRGEHQGDGGHHGPQRHGQDHAVQEPDGRAADQERLGQRGRPGDQPRRELPPRRQGHRLRAAGPDDLPDAQRRGEHPDRAGEREAPPHSRRDLRAVPGAVGHAPAQGRQPVGWPAAAAGNRPRAGDRAQGAAARRADRRHSALDHQGHRQGAERDPPHARHHHRGERAGAELRAGRGRPAVRPPSSPRRWR